MIKAIESVLLFSENPEKLAEFYKETLGLRVGMEGEYGGKNREPERYMVNFEVDDIENEVKKLEKAKVKKIQDIYHVQDYGKIATFVDPDGNYFQLVQTRPSAKEVN